MRKENAAHPVESLKQHFLKDYSSLQLQIYV